MTEMEVAGKGSVDLVLEVNSEASIEACWGALSDTDRFNAIAGFHYAFQELKVEGEPATRLGRGTWLGFLPLTWTERRFRHNAPREMHIVRSFRGSPGKELRIHLSLTPAGEGTRVRYAVSVIPRSPLLAPLVRLQLMLEKGKLLGALQAIASAAGDPPALRQLLPPPPLSADGAAHLDAALKRVDAPEVVSLLRAWIAEAPVRDQDHMHPLRLAREWGLPEEDVVRAFLAATHEGALAIQWEVICPACRLPRMELSRLSEVVGGVHCDACDVSFDPAFPDSLAVSFRPAQPVREIEIQPACLGGPGQRPHVVAEADVFKDRTTELSLDLAVGTYRLRCWPALPMAVIEVEEGGDDALPEVKATEAGFKPTQLKVRPGAHLLKVTGAVRRPLDLVVERRFLPRGVLTGGRVLAMPGGRALLPEGFLDMDTLAEVSRGVVVALDSRGEVPVDQLVRPFGAVKPRFLHKRWDGVLACFDDVESALAGLQAVAERTPLSAAMDIGPLVEAMDGDKRVPLGLPLDRAVDLLKTTPLGKLHLPPEALKDAALLAALEARGWAATPVRSTPFEAPSAVGVALG